LVKNRASKDPVVAITIIIVIPFVNFNVLLNAPKAFTVGQQWRGQFNVQLNLNEFFGVFVFPSGK
jgi:hypothetical protein